MPSDVDASEILSRVTSTDPDLRMPPEGARLTGDEVSALRDWIHDGAQWKEHWAFRTLTRPDVPVLESGSKTHDTNPIDAFIQTGLQSIRCLFHPKQIVERCYAGQPTT